MPSPKLPKMIPVVFRFARSGNIVAEVEIPKQKSRQQTIAMIAGYALSLKNRTCYAIDADYETHLL